VLVVALRCLAEPYQATVLIQYFLPLHRLVAEEQRALELALTGSLALQVVLVAVVGLLLGQAQGHLIKAMPVAIIHLATQLVVVVEVPVQLVLMVVLVVVVLLLQSQDQASRALVVEVPELLQVSAAAVELVAARLELLILAVAVAELIQAITTVVLVVLES
jgi:hypothetical protein